MLTNRYHSCRQAVREEAMIQPLSDCSFFLDRNGCLLPCRRLLCPPPSLSSASSARAQDTAGLHL